MVFIKLFSSFCVSKLKLRAGSRRSTNKQDNGKVFAFYSSQVHKFLWHGTVVVITTAQLHSTKPQLRLCSGSNPARGMWEIRDGEDL